MAGMAELVDARDSKPRDASHESSILSPGTGDHVFPHPLTKWLIADVILLNALVLLSGSNDAIFLYYVIWLGGFGWLFVAKRERITAWLRALPISPPLKFILLGYAAVLLEETLVALVHAAAEGSMAHFFTLLMQFWAFNVFAFTGFIFGWRFLLQRYRYTAMDLFLLVGVWGLFSEHTLSFFAANPIAAVLLILPTMCTYNLIIAPAIASLPTPSDREQARWIRYPYSLLMLFTFSAIPVLILFILRVYFPGAFPSCANIAC